MKKSRSIFWITLALLLLLLITIPVAAGRGGWMTRVSGGMSDSSDILGLTVSLNAWLNADGSVGGQGQYDNPVHATYHLKVSEFCTGTVPSILTRKYAGHRYAVAMGPVIGADGEWGAIAVVEGGATEPDAVWTAFVRFSGTIKSMFYDCSNPPKETEDNIVYSFPKDVLEGNFTIRFR